MMLGLSSYWIQWVYIFIKEIVTYREGVIKFNAPLLIS